MLAPAKRDDGKWELRFHIGPVKDAPWGPRCLRKEHWKHGFTWDTEAQAKEACEHAIDYIAEHWKNDGKRKKR